MVPQKFESGRVLSSNRDQDGVCRWIPQFKPRSIVVSSAARVSVLLLLLVLRMKNCVSENNLAPGSTHYMLSSWAASDGCGFVKNCEGRGVAISGPCGGERESILLVTPYDLIWLAAGPSRGGLLWLLILVMKTTDLLPCS
ncbi:PREDICTED: uncharacterized protein LOC104811818 [Tarenaya hassleriana]|uniref:uncharacterized protein LOC104811818 n=1 Tax=Tarenaya hassleriana TaxID=28532 RepID=UPI00053C82E6|nr:PREDICTED: uncharacterized protein LOC104811818 [Tarenaya hassleriana]XP_010536944.1 PREDICTED: uncharacterized protein LOC104811818 [Tarenaya hassleriana]